MNADALRNTVAVVAATKAGRWMLTDVIQFAWKLIEKRDRYPLEQEQCAAMGVLLAGLCNETDFREVERIINHIWTVLDEKEVL